MEFYIGCKTKEIRTVGCKLNWPHQLWFVHQHLIVVAHGGTLKISTVLAALSPQGGFLELGYMFRMAALHEQNTHRSF